MKNFHFRLAALLQLREADRDRKRQELAESQRADRRLADQLDNLKNQRIQVHDASRAAAGPGPVDLARLVEAHRCDAALRLREIELKRQRRALADEIERRRQLLVEAERGVQSLEKLREAQSHSHYQEENRREGKRLDEAALRAGKSCQPNVI